MGKMKTVVSVVRPQQLLNWMVNKEPIVRFFDQTIAAWGTAKEPPLCLTCDHEFTSVLSNVDGPHAFLLVEVGIKKTGGCKQVMVSGFCKDCAKRNEVDLLNAAREVLSRTWPGAFDDPVISFVGAEPGRPH